MKKIIEFLKYVYSRVMGRHFQIFANAAHRTAVKSHFGFWYVGDVGDSADVAYGIVQNGIVEPRLTGAIISKLHRAKSFYDIGSHTGYYAILAAYLNPEIQSYGFEVEREFIRDAEESKRLNQLKNCQFFNYAVGDKNEIVKFTPAGSGTWVGEGQREALQFPLDDLIKKYKLLPPSILQIDVEGWELNVLKGAKITLGKFHPLVFFESLPGNNSYLPITHFLEGVGYTTFARIEDNNYLAT